MGWTKQNENFYTHTTAPFSLSYINGTWFVVDNRDQSKAIPFDDIFNNPVFSIDFSSANLIVNSLDSTTTILGNHIRGESANTPSTPAHSFKTEISSGLYRESAGVLAISILGTKVLTINSLPSFLGRSWVNFNGSTATIRSSGNVSSINYNAAGLYTVNMTVGMGAANYAVTVGCASFAGGLNPHFSTPRNGISAGSFQILVMDTVLNQVDSSEVYAMVFR
jgi:hypothetical protein